MTEIAIKGTRQGLSITLPHEEEWDELLTQLETKLGEKEDFWSGTAILELGDRQLVEDALIRILDILKAANLGPVQIATSHPDTQAAANTLGITLYDPPAPSAPQEKAPAGNSLYLRQTIRSGQVVRHDGAVVICGDVNAGAEIIAGGDVVVFGTLRGVAHAGVNGDENARVVAVNLRPTQIRIAGKIARSPDHGTPPLSKTPEVAAIVNDEINISSLL